MKLSTGQAALLDSIRTEKAEFDQWERAAQSEFERLKDERKNKLRTLVGRAIDQNIPVRQIHLNGLGYKQVASMKTFLDRKSGLGKDDILAALRGVDTGALDTFGEALLAPTTGDVKKPEFVQKPGEAHWIDPHTGEARVTPRLDGPVYFYYMNDATLAALTEEEREWFANDAKTLMGTDEYDRYMNDGDEPERWETQPDAKMRR